MTIAFVSDAIYPYNKGGKEKRLYELSRRLAGMGYDVHIYCMQWWDGPKDRVENGVNLHAISKYYPLYKGDRRSIKEGIIFGLAGFRMINKKFDIIDVDHMPFFPIISIWLVCLIRGKKLYGTWHEALTRADWVDYMGVLPGNIAALIERICIRLPHTITANSEHTLELIRSELKRTKNLYLVTPGIDYAEIKDVKKLPIKCDLLFAGRMVKDKNLSLLVDSVKLLTKNNPDIECFIIGHGIEEKNLKKQIKKMKLEDNIHMLPPVASYLDIYAYMKAAKVFVLPSKREGFGMVALEALACGTPVVTLDSPANATKSLIQQNINGSIVNSNAQALANALQQWLDETPKESFISRLVKDYDWQNLAQKQAEVYVA